MGGGEEKKQREKAEKRIYVGHPQGGAFTPRDPGERLTSRDQSKRYPQWRQERLGGGNDEKGSEKTWLDKKKRLIA